MVATMLVASDGRAQRTVSSRCGVGVPASESQGYVPFPRGDVFCPLVADPKGLRTFISVLHATSDERLANSIGAIGIGDAFGIARWGGPGPGEGVQIGLTASVFAQFDVATASFQLLNADYNLSLPVTFRYRGFSGRARIYHESAHLGDDLLLRPDSTEREDLAFESIELLLSQDVGPLRLIAGGERLIHRKPVAVKPLLAHAGVELRPGGRLVRLGPLAGLRLIAALDVKMAEDQSWDPGWSVRSGFEIDRPRDSDPPGRRWRVLYEWYEGPSPYGQFYRSVLRYYGVGLHFAL